MNSEPTSSKTFIILKLTYFSEEKEYKVNIAIINLSATIKTLWSMAEEGDSLLIESVGHQAFEDFLTYCELINYNRPPKIRKPIQSKQMNTIVGDHLGMYIDLIAEDLDRFYKLLVATRYFSCDGLYDLILCKIATWWKEVKIDEMREDLDVKGKEFDLTEADVISLSKMYPQEHYDDLEMRNEVLRNQILDTYNSHW